MAYALLNEPAINAMYSRLTTNLNPTIDAINAYVAANPSVPQYAIPYPAQVLDAPPVVGQLTQFPTIAIADGDQEYMDDVGWSTTTAMDLYIVAYLSNVDPKALAWQLRRYAQALVTTAIATRDIDSGAWGAGLKKVIPGQRFKPNPGKPEIVSWISVCIWAKNEDNWP